MLDNQLTIREVKKLKGLRAFINFSLDGFVLEENHSEWGYCIHSSRNSGRSWVYYAIS